MGGGLGARASVARPVGYPRARARGARRASSACCARISRSARPAQTFHDFTAAHTDDELRALLAGGTVSAVARDLPVAATPHNLE